MYLLTSISCATMITHRHLVIPSPNEFVYKKLLSIIISSWKSLPLVSVKGSVIVMCSVFSVVFMTNVMSMLPYVGATSAHLYLSMVFALPMWMYMFISRFAYRPVKAVRKYIPTGVPAIIALVVIVLELIRVLIRPLSLRLRLAVNITAGHCVIRMLRQAVIGLSFCCCRAAFPVFAFYVVYYLIELGVAVIQAYIFITLVGLYRNDHS